MLVRTRREGDGNELRFYSVDIWKALKISKLELQKHMGEVSS